jgi:CDP-diacylglycerol---serine O-phosphatidyltransferase
MKKHIPNFFTLGNALCGCIGIVACLQNPINTVLASIMIFIACVLDFSDGFVARALKVQSEMGKQLDSLADAITFGVLPAVIAYIYIEKFSYFPNNPEFDNFKYIGFLMALASIWRLAKFNIDARQSDSFIGVPTPANAIFWAAFPLIERYNSLSFANWTMFLVLSVVMSVLMVSELPLFALKFKNFQWKDNQIKYIFLILSILCIVLLKFYTLPAIIILYILLSVLELFVKKTK